MGRELFAVGLDVVGVEVFFGGNDKCFMAFLAVSFDDVVTSFVRSGRSGGGLLSPSLLSLKKQKRFFLNLM